MGKTWTAATSPKIPRHGPEVLRVPCQVVAASRSVEHALITVMGFCAPRMRDGSSRSAGVGYSGQGFPVACGGQA